MEVHIYSGVISPCPVILGILLCNTLYLYLGYVVVNRLGNYQVKFRKVRKKNKKNKAGISEA